jgi:hypothetical protein
MYTVTTTTNSCNIPSSCARYGAFVDCLVTVYQGAGACFSIQIYDDEKNRADVESFDSIQIVIQDVGKNIIALASSPTLIGSPIDITLDKTSDGKLNFCLNPENTLSGMTGKLMADIQMMKNNSSGYPDIIYISCLQIGILQSSAFTTDLNSPIPAPIPIPIVPLNPYYSESTTTITI